MEDNETASDQIRDRNIIDMLRDDQSSGSKKNWKAFRDKLRLKRAGRAWTSSVPVPASDIAVPKTNRMIRRGSWRYSTKSEESEGEATRQLGDTGEKQRSGRLFPVETDPEEDATEGEEKGGSGDGDQQMSLMSLLSSDGSNYVEDEEEQHGVDIEGDGEKEDDEDCEICLGCKGKHSKGAALGVCGHTFCKHCTNELHVSKGNCPGCNDFILEILDLF